MPAATLGMLGQFPGLTSLQLSDNPFDLDRVLAGLPALPRLRVLALHSRVCTGGRTPLPLVRRHLARFPALTAFEYRHSWRPNPSGIQVRAPCCAAQLHCAFLVRAVRRWARLAALGAWPIQPARLAAAPAGTPCLSRAGVEAVQEAALTPLARTLSSASCLRLSIPGVCRWVPPC